MIETKKPPTELKADQLKGLEALETWLYSSFKPKDETCFFKLLGAAGTGKTTLLSVFLERIKHPYRKSEVCICAPTHKAKKVLKEKTGWNNAETLQALLGLKLDTNIDDFDINSPTFNPIGDRKIKDYRLVIIDESSMINEDLFVTICDCAKAVGTKVIFAGDKFQLNPVKEYNISLSLISPQAGYELTEIIRQSSTNPLIYVLDILRQDIENGTNSFMQYLQNNPIQYNLAGEGYEVINGTKTAELMQKEFSSQNFKDDKNYCRYITWTNQNICQTNQWLRGVIIDKKEPLIQGELMLSYKTLLVDEELLIVNSDDYEVDEISEPYKNEYQIEVYPVKLKCIDTESISNVKVVKPSQVNYQQFNEVHNDYLDTAKRLRGKHWNKYYEFRNSMILLEDLFTTLEYNNKPFLVTKKDIDYGYSITIHKSQGSTYNTVFVNGKDINKNFNNFEKTRLWYVACSRTSNKCYINL